MRFDNDPEHESENHPRYHIDIHLDNKATYKLGVYDILSTNEFIDLLNNNAKVRFIESSHNN